MAPVLLRGFALGFVIALTPGPMFVLCLRRTLTSGPRDGLLTGLGIASADAIYAAVAAGVLGAAGLLLGASERWLTLAGGVALAAIGLRALLRGAAPEAPAPRAGGAYLSALGLTLANPATILSFAALFAALGSRSLLTVVAVAAGSLAWWVLLVAGAGRLRSAAGARVARLLAAGSGLALVAFGVVAVGSALSAGR